MIRHLRDIKARRRGEEVVESGFTLIELLVVIVVLGILAATVVFALSGVTGQSAQAACNSDAKTVEVAVQAYIDSPDNATNAPPRPVGTWSRRRSTAGITAQATRSSSRSRPTRRTRSHVGAAAVTVDSDGHGGHATDDADDARTTAAPPTPAQAAT